MENNARDLFTAGGTGRLNGPHPLRAGVLGAACVAALSITPVAQAMPAGMDPAAIQAAISSPISVAAGTTTSVSLPYPVDASYSGGGWEISASGGSATITAPAEGGSVVVPVSAGGYSASITLVATAPQDAMVGGTGDAAQPGTEGAAGGDQGGQADSNAQPGAGAEGAADGSSGSAAGGAAAGGGSGAAQRPGGRGYASADTVSANNALPEVPGEKVERKPAAPADNSHAERIELDSQISDNVITAKLSITQALDLYSRFKDTDRNGVTLRYVDSEGRIIKDVKRDIDQASRTLTLTYPAGQAPDNPFIMQLVNKDGSGVSVEVVLRDPSFKSADVVAAPEGVQATDAPAASDKKDGGASAGLWAKSWLIALAVAAVGAIMAFGRVAKRAR